MSHVAAAVAAVARIKRKSDDFEHHTQHIRQPNWHDSWSTHACLLQSFDLWHGHVLFS